MTRFRLFLIAFLSCATLALAGCESAEDKAERFYQAGLTLLEQGDKDRAAIELRNVFDHDGFHKEARMLYAGLVLELGRSQEAYGQYLRLIEQYPDTVEARVALAKLAIAQNNWPEVERHGAAAIALAPDQPEVKSIDLAIQYRKAAIDRDAAKRAEIAAQAEAVLAETRSADTPDDDGLVRVVIDNYIQSDEPAKALGAVNAALERAPVAEDLNLIKVRLLAQTEDIEGTGAHLKNMVEMFPDNVKIKQTMIRWYMSQGDLAGAEAFLRTQAGDDTAPVEGHVAVVQMLQATQGADSARAELTRLQMANAGTENGRFYAGMLASMDFQSGERDKAIADIRAAVDASEQGAQKLRLQVMLAQMLLNTGAEADAHALIDTVLENDASNIPALRMRAARLIDEDKPGEAIVALRSALDQNPRDAATLTLMARAHERDGDTDLVGERLALAMEASGNAVPETLRYAQFLIGQGRQQVAITVLEDARRRTPRNVQLLAALANMYLRSNDWPQARTLALEINRLGTPEAQRASTELEARILQGENRTDDSLALLQEQLGDSSDASANEQVRAIGMIVQTQIRSGKTNAARTTLNEALAEHPENPDLQLLSAVLFAVEGEFDQSEAIYRTLLGRFPGNELPVRMLVNMLNGTGRPDEAKKVLDTALDTMPDRLSLLWMKASYLENDGDYDAAIAIYEKLYEANSGIPVLANNLASLITTHRDDPESLTRAANIVRRLRDTKVPAFQDTYGWIAYRRENYDEALEYLEPAAQALISDPLVQYHLGMTYVALGRIEEAKAQLEKTLEMAGDSPLPQFEKARETLAGLN